MQHLGDSLALSSHRQVHRALPQRFHPHAHTPGRRSPPTCSEKRDSHTHSASKHKAKHTDNCSENQEQDGDSCNEAPQDSDNRWAQADTTQTSFKTITPSNTSHRRTHTLRFHAHTVQRIQHAVQEQHKLDDVMKEKPG